MKITSAAFIAPTVIILIIGCIAVSGWFRYGSNRAPLERGERAMQNRRPNEFANGQPYLVFATNDFEIKYPDWPTIDRKNLPAETDEIPVAVHNEGCSFIIKEHAMPAGGTPEAYLEKSLESFGSRLTINKKEVSERQVYLDADISVNGMTVKQISMSFFTEQGNAYGVAFVAEKNSFPGSCEPLVQEVLGSVKADQM